MRPLIALPKLAESAHTTPHTHKPLTAPRNPRTPTPPSLRFADTEADWQLEFANAVLAYTNEQVP